MTPPTPFDPEATARTHIDALLSEAGWIVQSRMEMNLAAGVGVAIREFPTDAGPCDYLLFVDKKPAGIIEAKKEGVALTGVEAQTLAYATSLPDWLHAPISPVPFLYESTGIETRFTSTLDPTPRSRRVFSFHRPETLRQWLSDATAAQGKQPGAPTAASFIGRLQCAPPLNTAGMWPAQIEAVQNLERSLQEGRPRALVQMATGAGKTFTTIAAVYRLIKYGGARRVLFLVDRGNLGRQAHKEFQAYTAPDDGRKFTELYNVARLTSNVIDPVNRVIITTIQRLYSILKGEPEFADDEEGSRFQDGETLHREPPPVVYSRELPPEFFDVIIIDECHRSIYSLWRQVLEYFDASLVGLTATPASHTYAFFDKNVVSEYTHAHAVRDRVNVPFEVYEIRTRITEQGALLAAEPDAPVVVGRRDRQTRAMRWELLDEDLSYAGSALDNSVVAKDQIRTVVRTIKEKLFTEIFPGRTEIPKMLFFAKNDNHAEDILDIVRQEFGLGNEGAVKITYKPERAIREGGGASQRPDEIISRFRNSFHPRIAVTVDMIATGTDIKPLECVVFLRTVRSRGLFEQMKGRGVRVIPEADFQAVTPDAKTKTHFVIIDAVGVMREQKSDPPLLRSRSITFETLLERIRAGNRDEEVLATFAARLDRMDRRLNRDQQEAIEEASGGATLYEMLSGILEAIDPDREEDSARRIFSLPPEQVPTDAQLDEARSKLREGAIAPIAENPTLCRTLLEVRRQQEQIIDDTSLDELLSADFLPGVDRDREMIASFQEFIATHRDEIDALQVLYARPYRQRLTRAQIRSLADAIRRPPQRWTTEALWSAYERLEAGRVRGASAGRLWTDIVSLARHALHPEEELVSFSVSVSERFDNWLAQQANAGRTFSDEALRWLERIRDRIAGDAEVCKEDLDDVPFIDDGGLGRFYELFGEGYERILDELNAELVA